MERKSLFDIDQEYDGTMLELEQYFLDNPEADGEVPEAFLDLLFVNQNEMESKLEAYYYKIAELKGESETIDFQIKRLQAKKEAKARVEDKLKHLVAEAVKKYGTPTDTGGAKFQTKTVKLSYIKTESVAVNAPELLPDEYVSFNLSWRKLTRKQLELLLQAVKAYDAGISNSLTYLEVTDSYDTSPQADKTKLKAALHEKKDIPGAKLEPGGYIKFT